MAGTATNKRSSGAAEVLFGGVDVFVLFFPKKSKLYADVNKTLTISIGIKKFFVVPLIR